MLVFITLLLFAIPKEDSSILNLTWNIESENNGKITQFYKCDSTINTDLAADVYADPRFRWNTAFQKLTSLKAYTINGSKKLSTPQKRAVNTVVPFGASKTPEGTYIRETVVSHIGIRKGSQIHTSWKLIDIKKRKFKFEKIIPLYTDRNIKNLNISVKGLKLGVSSLPFSCKLIANTLRCKNMSSLGMMDTRIHRTLNSNYGYFVPRAIISQWKSWNELALELKKETKNYDKFIKEVHPNLNLFYLLDKKLKNAVSDRERFEIIENFVTNVLRELKIKRIQISPEKIFKYGVATKREKILLFASLLKKYSKTYKKVRVAYYSPSVDLNLQIPALVQVPYSLLVWENNTTYVYDFEKKTIISGFPYNRYVLDFENSNIPFKASGKKIIRKIHLKATFNNQDGFDVNLHFFLNYYDTNICKKIPKSIKVSSCNIVFKSYDQTEYNIKGTIKLLKAKVLFLPSLSTFFPDLLGYIDTKRRLPYKSIAFNTKMIIDLKFPNSLRIASLFGNGKTIFVQKPFSKFVKTGRCTEKINFNFQNLRINTMCTSNGEVYNGKIQIYSKVLNLKYINQENKLLNRKIISFLKAKHYEETKN